MSVQAVRYREDFPNFRIALKGTSSYDCCWDTFLILAHGKLKIPPPCRRCAISTHFPRMESLELPFSENNTQYYYLHRPPSSQQCAENHLL